MALMLHQFTGSLCDLQYRAIFTEIQKLLTEAAMSNIPDFTETDGTFSIDKVNSEYRTQIGKCTRLDLFIKRLH